MKKIIAVMASVILVLANSYCVFAENTIEDETLAVLTNVETGERFEFPAEVMVTLGVQTRSGDGVVQSMKKTVQVTIPEQLTNPNARIPVDKTTSDVSGSCRATLNIDYLTYTEDGVNYYKLTHLDGGWEELDRQVSTSNRVYAYDYRLLGKQAARVG